MKPSPVGVADAPAPAERFQTAESLVSAFATAMTAREVDLAAACFSRDACFITPDATTVRGREDIRAVLAQLLATCLRVEVELHTCLTTGRVALSSERWKVSFKHAESAPFIRSSISTMVLSEIEGSWKVAVAAPWRN